jgi:hypothetical protein
MYDLLFQWEIMTILARFHHVIWAANNGTLRSVITNSDGAMT